MKYDTFPESSFAYKIYDPIHGFIRLTPLEMKVVQSIPFQRLHQISQLGLSYLVYPGARHTRFEHSLGVMELASKLFLSVFKGSSLQIEELTHWHQVVRLAGLCHDLGHLPFSHTAEKALLGEMGHEHMTAKILKSPFMDEVWEMTSLKVKEDVLDLCLSPLASIQQGRSHHSPWMSLLSQLISDDNFGADRMDYLLRDAYFTGVHFGGYDHLQLIDTLTFLPENTPKLALHSSGIQAVESLWVARYMMYARLYFHPKVRLYGIQMTRFMRQLYSLGLPQEIEHYLLQTDATVLEALKQRRDHCELNRALYRGSLFFQEIPIDRHELSDQNIEQLQENFGDELIVDCLLSQPPSRKFPVITSEGKLLYSTELSPFLNEIPSGHAILRLYCNPKILEDIKYFLAKFA